MTSGTYWSPAMCSIPKDRRPRDRAGGIADAALCLYLVVVARNHDFARNSGLWHRVRAKGAANIRILAGRCRASWSPGSGCCRHR